MGDHAPDGAGAESAVSDPAALERGRRLFAGECGFFHAAQRASDMPARRAPEIAFAGRSNVGKSSLLNALTGRSTLARVSKEPGRTQQLNFFALGPDVEGRKLVLVDMPGYGFARVSRSLLSQWSALIRQYLRGRAGLARVLVLVDARHGLKPNDRELFAMLDEAAVSWQVVLTKCDALGAEALRARHAELARETRQHTAGHPDVLLTSAETGAGIPELRAALASLAAFG
ncbi:MAG: YihA family ribosome biogenesis GTP-binding protein [Alphaproteobacteria bacterium]|nr:YihA family ribosome biogenesis GTP-binding protein [Alphaproteobacteria bacterium]